MAEKSLFDHAADDLSPPFNVYSGRDTSIFRMTEFAPSLTRQDMADECDINLLMARYQQTGTMPQHPDRQPFYVDNIDLPSYQDAMNIMIEADAAFMSLPADVRREFDNDPAKFVDFASDDKNVDKLRGWKMLSPEAEERLDAAKAAEAALAADRTGVTGKVTQGGSETASPAPTQ